MVDAGALQMVDPNLLNNKCVITPHARELILVSQKIKGFDLHSKNKSGQIPNSDSLVELSRQLNHATILLKDQIDIIINHQKTYLVAGGNAGMTKGGTGDVLAGLVAGLYCTNDLLPGSSIFN